MPSRRTTDERIEALERLITEAYTRRNRYRRQEQEKNPKVMFRAPVAMIEQAKIEAARRGINLSELIRQGLRLVLPSGDRLDPILRNATSRRFEPAGSQSGDDPHARQAAAERDRLTKAVVAASINAAHQEVGLKAVNGGLVVRPRTNVINPTPEASAASINASRQEFGLKASKGGITLRPRPLVGAIHNGMVAEKSTRRVFRTR